MFFPEVSLSDFSLRSASEIDYPAIKRLIKEVGINPTGLDWHRFIVATTSSGAFAGCGQLKPHSDGSLEMASIAVMPLLQNQGLGGIMIRKLISDARFPLYLTCRSQLESYYKQFGFRIASDDELPKYFLRLRRLAGVISALHIINERMLVMVLD